MKKITLSLALLFAVPLLAQTYSTGMMNFTAGSSGSGANLNFSAQIDVNATTVTLTLVGPSTGWLGIGFGNTTMANSGDVVIFDGTNLSDRHFIGFGTAPDLDAVQNWTVTANTVASGVRTVVGTRARSTGDTDDFTFSASATSLSVVYARRLSDFSIDYHGNSSCGSRTANFTLGNDEFKLDDFKMSPNPATGFVSIQLPTQVDTGVVKMYDALGRVVKRQEITTTENQINTSDLTSGSYMVVLRTDYGNATKTLVVK